MHALAVIAAEGQWSGSIGTLTMLSGACLVTLALAYAVRKTGVGAWLERVYSRVPAPADRIASLMALARSGAVNPSQDAPAARADSRLRMALDLAQSCSTPDILRARLDARRDEWLLKRLSRLAFAQRVLHFAPFAGFGLLVVCVPALLAFADTSNRPEAAAASLVFGALFAGVITLCVGMSLADESRRGAAPELLDRELITTGLVAIRRGRPPEAIEQELVGLLPPGTRSSAAFAAA